MFCPENASKSISWFIICELQLIYAYENSGVDVYLIKCIWFFAEFVLSVTVFKILIQPQQ